MNIGINEYDECFFAHPDDSSLKVFVFTDPLHLLKLIRNNYIDKGFIINDIFVGKEYIEKMLLLNESELNIIHKLNKFHLDVKGTERQKVIPAAQLLSGKTAKSVVYCNDQAWFHIPIEGDEKSYNHSTECAEIIQTVNEF